MKKCKKLYRDYGIKTLQLLNLEVLKIENMLFMNMKKTHPKTNLIEFIFTFN